jgi:hypothetical protein
VTLTVMPPVGWQVPFSTPWTDAVTDVALPASVVPSIAVTTTVLVAALLRSAASTTTIVSDVVVLDQG